MTYKLSLTLEEKVGSLFQPDPVLPAQYFETFRRKMPSAPEKSLMLAVLEDAIVCFHKYARARNGRGERLFREAKEWILEENSDWLFSFDNICAALGLDPSYLRHGLMQEKEKLEIVNPVSWSQASPDSRKNKKPGKKRKYRPAA